MDYTSGVAVGMAMEDSREEIIRSLIKEGVILPEYDWSDKSFVEEEEKIIVDWFKRHPETTRGTGQFKELYPKIDEATTLLFKMSEFKRITPAEFLVLYRELFNF